MKVLVLFAVAAFVGSVYCDQECFRAIFKDCVKRTPPRKELELCDEIVFQINCVYKTALKCKMPFEKDAADILSGLGLACYLKDWYNEDRTCYKNAINDNECAEPMIEAMKGSKTFQDVIRANKKICNLMEPYSNCVEKKVEKNCHGTDMSTDIFNYINRPHLSLSKSLCEQLIIPADEKDSRPDNFGNINVYESLRAIFGSE